MLAETEEQVVLDVPYSDTDYPQELLDLWDREVEIMRAKIATGELKHQSLREAAAERGITYGV